MAPILYDFRQDPGTSEHCGHSAEHLARSRSCAAPLVFAAALALGACGLFEDLTPENIAFEMTGEDGARTEVVYATDFVAGVDAGGVTHVQVFNSDTVFHTLPIDTVMSIAEDQRWLVHVSSLDGDTLDVTVVVNVDGRTLVSRGGGIFPEAPWQYVYVFNEQLTGDVEVTF